jgi:hypothetical protein
MVRLFLLLIVLGLSAGCVSEEQVFSHTDHDPVPGEATPAPRTDPRSGWAW